MSTGRDLGDGYPQVQCIESEGEALLRLKQDFNDTYNILSSWALGSNFCKWEGVGCNETTGHVTSLHIRNLGLQGKLNSALLGLPYLTYLDLSSNDFRWSQVPEFLGSLNHLQHLILSDAGFFGTVPDHLGNLSSLILLDLSYNHDLSANNLEWLHCLSSLEVLDLTHIDLSSTAAGWIHAINTMPSLVELRLGNCELGYLPPSLPQVNCDSLLALSLGSNKFNSSTILDWLFQCCPNIRRIDLSDNYLTGPLPLTWSQTHLGKHSSLKELYLSNNHLYGPLKRSLAQLPELVAIDVAQNGLQDIFTDADFQNFSNLKVLILSGNHWIFNLTKNWVPPFQLERLGLANCQLGPQFPNWIRTQNNLSVFDISSNDISGAVPTWFWDVSAKIEIMKLHSNYLLGNLPNYWTNATNLKILSLNENNFSGPIPASLGNLTNLIVLILRSNAFEGNIPSELCQMNSLQLLDLSLNQLSGTIPRCIFVAMATEEQGFYNDPTFKYVGHSAYIYNYYREPLSLDWEGSNYMTYSLLKALDLSSNFITGGIPEEITSNEGLIALNLSRNQLEGSIPLKIGKMKNLEALDLSRNKLSGIIPSSLSDLGFLSLLNVSHNNLTGQIPSGVQLATFDATSFMENPNLCGNPLNKSCNTNQSLKDRHGQSEKGGRRDSLGIPSFYTSMASGLIISFWTIWGPLF